MTKEIEQRAKEKMAKTRDALAYDLSTLKAGRANPKMLDKVYVDYYGSPTQISQVAAITSPEPRVLLVSPWDASQLKAVEKALLASDLGLNPSNDGKQLRIIIPQLTEERRKELVKLIAKYGEEAKVAMRNIRRSAIEELKKAEKLKTITEDDLKNGEKSIQKLLDDYTKEIDDVAKEKEKEVTTI
ncbi:MAG: ribosome recycling factor [Eubacteriaceae bacterium]|nr:ribosome recycling factor [Eubacteriaceae bacterium]